MFFAEQEKKWTILNYKLKEKIGYYKDLCKTLTENKNIGESRLEKINNILYSKKLTEENLNDHKTLINNLSNMLNEKRDSIYILKNDIENLKKELNLFVYGFEKIKLDSKVREKIKEIDINGLMNKINEELNHKM